MGGQEGVRRTVRHIALAGQELAVVGRHRRDTQRKAAVGGGAGAGAAHEPGRRRRWQDLVHFMQSTPDAQEAEQ